MSSLKLLNQDAEHAKRFVALAMNINAAKGLQEVLKTNLGPKVRTLRTCSSCTPTRVNWCHLRKNKKTADRLWGRICEWDVAATPGL